MSRIEEQVMEKIRKRYDPNISDTWKESLCKRIADRAEHGKVKYHGMTLERTDLTRLEWLVHTEQEIMDALNYTEKLIDDAETLGAEEQYFQNVQRVLIEALFNLGMFIEDESRLDLNKQAMTIPGE